MNNSSTASKNVISLLLIDDNKPSRIVQAYVVEQEFNDVRVTNCEDPPPMQDMLRYDGLILDERLLKDSGMEIARRVHKENWRIPMLIMSNLEPSDPIFEQAYDVVDYVANKGDPKVFINTMRAFVRQIRRLKDLQTAGGQR